MSIHIGDTILVHVNDESHSQRIGVLEYIGYIDSNQQSKFVGINLVESVENGHNGTINGMQHFTAPQGHGIYVRMQNIIRKLNCTEVTMKMQQIIMLFKKRLTQYITALSERDEYIEELKNSRRRLKKILNKSKNHSSSNNTLLHTIEELMTAPPPISVMMPDESTYPVGKQKKCKKQSEYTKYSDQHKNIACSISDTSSYTDTTSDNDINGAANSSDDITWCDDGYCSSKKCQASTSISISTRSKQSKQNSISNTQKNKMRYKHKQKSLSAHNTPHQSPIVHWNIPQAAYDDGNNVYTNPQNMQLYDMMVQQQQLQLQMQPIQRTNTVPSFQNLLNTKRRSLHQNKPIPEVRHQSHHRREKTLKLQNRRSNSADMRYYFNDAQVVKNHDQMNDLNIKQFQHANVDNNRWIQQQYHNNSPIEAMYAVSQTLQYHF